MVQVVNQFNLHFHKLFPQNPFYYFMILVFHVVSFSQKFCLFLIFSIYATRPVHWFDLTNLTIHKPNINYSEETFKTKINALYWKYLVKVQLRIVETYGRITENRIYTKWNEYCWCGVCQKHIHSVVLTVSTSIRNLKGRKYPMQFSK
jgi:hypothetical protein